MSTFKKSLFTFLKHILKGKPVLVNSPTGEEIYARASIEQRIKVALALLKDLEGDTPQEGSASQPPLDHQKLIKKLQDYVSKGV